MKKKTSNMSLITCLGGENAILLGPANIYYEVDLTGTPDQAYLSGLPDSDWPSGRPCSHLCQ
jgi:hypothetical protein